MKRHYRILLLTDSGSDSGLMDFGSGRFSFVPGSRYKNYLELLSGFGIPFDVRDVNVLQPHHCLKEDEILYSAVLFASPLHKVPKETLSFLRTYSSRYGVSLITDAFLLSGKRLLHPFGLKRCSGLCVRIQRISDRDRNVLYNVIRFPYSAKGIDIGIRPLLRFFFQSWFSRKIEIEKEANPIAYFNEYLPAIVSFPYGKAINYFLNFQPSLVLKSGNPIHSFVRDMFESNPHIASASFDLSHTICLRMDDPGSSERVHLEGYNAGVISPRQWREVNDILSTRNVHLNVAYVPQWVDDGNSFRGTLTYRGKPKTHRKPGALYDSWDVIYTRSSSSHGYDYVSEYQAIMEGVRRGSISILSHGLTHLSMNIDAWLKAADKYTNKKWFREFRNPTSGGRSQKAVLIERMKESSDLIQKAFGTRPEIIIPSAHEHTPTTPIWAREAGYSIFSSRSTFFLHQVDIIENRKILAFYLEDLFEGISWSKAGYPIIFVFHDYDIHQNHTTWLDDRILMFKRLGITQFLSMEVLCSVLMAGISVVSDNFRLNLDIDFRESLKHIPSRGNLPFRIGGKVSTMEVNGRVFAASLKIVGNNTYFSVPFSEVTDSRLSLSLSFC